MLKHLIPYRNCGCRYQLHSQNTQLINMTLPTLQLSVDRVYPFVGKDGVKRDLLKT
jgi:hypothetical protein